MYVGPIAIMAPVVILGGKTRRENESSASADCIGLLSTHIDTYTQLSAKIWCIGVMAASLVGETLRKTKTVFAYMACAPPKMLYELDKNYFS